MRRSTILFSSAAVLVLSAGLVLGRLSTWLKAGTRHAGHDRGWFQDTLGLSPDQKKNMDGIWADTKQQVDKLNDRRHGMDHERDTAIRALLTPEQSVAYDKIFTDNHAGHSELDKEREALFHSANDRSRALLTTDQRTKWDAMQKDMHDHEHHGAGAGAGHMGNGPASQTYKAGTAAS